MHFRNILRCLLVFAVFTIVFAIFYCLCTCRTFFWFWFLEPCLELWSSSISHSFLALWPSQIRFNPIRHLLIAFVTSWTDVDLSLLISLDFCMVSGPDSLVISSFLPHFFIAGTWSYSLTQRRLLRRYSFFSFSIWARVKLLAVGDPILLSPLRLVEFVSNHFEFRMLSLWRHTFLCYLTGNLAKSSETFDIARLWLSIDEPITGDATLISCLEQSKSS